MSEWFYEKNGQRIGPVMKEQLIGLLGAGDISHQTLVWHQSQQQWLPLLSTPLAADIPPSSVPPALPATAISNTLIWVLAFAPIIGIFCEGFVAGAVYHDTDQAANAVAEGSFFYISLIINIALSYWDERTLRNAGVNTQLFGKMVWLVPVYLWKRAKALQQKPTYFWCWLVTFLLIMLSSCSA